MAALLISPLCHCKHTPIGNKRVSRMIWSCQAKEKIRKCERKEERGRLGKFLCGVEKAGKGIKDSLSPREKGDWKDITLISLSFAVYVYMSQKIVCAYCVWMSMLGRP